MMRYYLLACFAPVLAFAADPANFTKDDLGKLPKGWLAAKTGEGEGSVWKVAADDSAPGKTGYALAQTAEGPKPLYNICVVGDSKMKDGELSAKIKAISGKIDQGGGLVWRYTDEKNYYVCRYNPIETNFRLYHVKNGERKQLASDEGIELPDGKWFDVSIKQTGKKIECSLNGKLYLQVEDDTFPEAGKVGVWTKADARSHFDSFRYSAAK